MHTLTSPYRPEAPFEDRMNHPLATESCMVTMLYGACTALGKISADSMTPEDFIEGAAQAGYRDGTWRHDGLGEYLGGLGVNFLSLDRNYSVHDVDEMIRVGRLNNPDTRDYVRDIIENTSGDGLARLSRKLTLTLGAHVLWGMKPGVNGYNGTIQAAAQHYVGFLSQLPGVGTRIWDPDLRPYLNESGLRPEHMCIDSDPGIYTIDYPWLKEHSNGRVICVWTDDTRMARVHASENSLQLNPDVQIDANIALSRCNIQPIQPDINDQGFTETHIGPSRFIYTYGANIKSPDHYSALHDFGKAIGVERLLIPNMGSHTGNVLVVEGSDYVVEEHGIASHPTNEASCDGLIVIEPTAPICIPGADCPIYVGSGMLKDGRRFTIGGHSGQIGMLRGLNENMVKALKALDVAEGTLEILVGPGAHTIELDMDYIEAFDTGEHDWRSAIVREYVGDDGRPRVILNVVASVVETLSGLGSMLASPPHVVMSNTLADPHVWSERGMAMHGQLPSKSNAVLVF